MTHVTCRLTAKNRDQPRNPIRSVIEYGLALPFSYFSLLYCKPVTVISTGKQAPVFVALVNYRPPYLKSASRPLEIRYCETL